MSKSSDKSALRPRRGSYWERSHRPLQALFFLAPLIVIYELGTYLFLHVPGGGVKDIVAHTLIQRFMEALGAAGFYLPGLAVVAVLLAWHILRRDETRFHPRLYVGMAIESIVLAVPLIMLGMVLFREAAAAQWMPGEGLWFLAGGDVDAGTWQQKLTWSIGAGIYEELLFRVIVIALAHLLLRDVLALPERTSAIGAVAVSALTFSLYHYADVNFLNWTGYDWTRFVFYSLSGVYLAGIYVLRGFGIVAGTHAMFDVIRTIFDYVAA